jgi:hypothetical protein
MDSYLLWTRDACEVGANGSAVSVAAHDGSVPEIVSIKPINGSEGGSARSEPSPVPLANVHQLLPEEAKGGFARFGFNTSGCPFGSGLLTSTECSEAGKAFGTTGARFWVINMSNATMGCSIHKDTSTFWNIQVTNATQAELAPLCSAVSQQQAVTTISSGGEVGVAPPPVPPPMPMQQGPMQPVQQVNPSESYTTVRADTAAEECSPKSSSAALLAAICCFPRQVGIVAPVQPPRGCAWGSSFVQAKMACEEGGLLLCSKAQLSSLALDGHDCPSALFWTSDAC